MRPLEDIRIIAIEQYGAGPFGSLHLADLGAEVIKIEDPRFGGDVGRYVPPFQEGEDSLFFEAFNRNKRSISLDISSTAGRAVFEDLVRGADAVYSNLRGDVPAKLGIRYEDLSHINPAVVCLSLSGFGMTGPRSAEPGYDYILQALAGWMSLTGEVDGPPTKSGLSLVDFSGGFVAAISLLAGIHAARRDGVGMDCDISLYDVAVTLLNYPATWHLTMDWAPHRLSRSAHPSLVPFQLFRGSDAWFVLGCAKEKFFRRVAEVIGRPELADDARFSSFAARGAHREELISILDELFATRTAAEWVDSLRLAGVPVAPVQEVSDALQDEHTAARGLIVETEHPTFGVVRSMASPVRVGPPDGTVHRRAPARHEDADYVLGGLLGYTPERVEQLTSEGAFGIPG
jgi:crotonobetainyl-CoA:carnitine CoA-transferase CaiB-like acyl-CoA transferase